MSPILSLLIVTTLTAAPTEGRYPEAAELLACDFEASFDRNFDGWPDGWTRRRGPGFPAFLKMGLSAEDSPAGKTTFRFDLDGGAASATSPPIAIDARYSFVLLARIKTNGLDRSQAVVSLSLLDEHKQPLETHKSSGISGTRDWQQVQLGPVAAANSAARYVTIGLHLEPTTAADLRGWAAFDDLWLGQLPRMTLETNQPGNLYQTGSEVAATCRISGTTVTDPLVDFTLTDALGNTIGQARRTLEATPPRTEKAPSGTQQVVWQPKIDRPGFYRLRAAMLSNDRVVLEREQTLAILPPGAAPRGNEFGWSLPQGDRPLPLSALAALLSQANVRWIKFPLWQDDADLAQSAARSRFVERLSLQQIELVGLLCDPPAALREKLGNNPSPAAADIFTPGPEVWYPALEGVMTRYSLKVRWWQLGRDEDASFIGYPRLPEKVGQIKQQLDRIGQNLNLGVAWNWGHELPPKGQSPLRFLALAADPPLTAEEISSYLAATTSQRAERWVALLPLPRSQYDVSTRAADLVTRMLAAKIHGAQRIFCTDPFSSERGLLNDDGTPGELLAPWSNTAGHLSGSKYLGSLRLPAGSRNQVFMRGEEALLVLWNERPCQESVYLGEEVRQHDLWGDSRTPEERDGKQVLEVGPLPSFVTGMVAPLAECSLTFRLQREQLPSIFGELQENGFVFKNHFPRGARGHIRLVPPEGWQVVPREFPFKLAAGEEMKQRFDVRFPYDANSGPADLRIEVEMTTDRKHNFSIYRTLQVGLGEMTLEASTRLTPAGELIVEQRIANLLDEEVSFKCDLFATARRRMRSQVVGLRRGEDVQTYRIPDARDLIGQTLWIRAEEIGGKRVLSQRFTATP